LIQIPIYADECRSRRELAGRRIQGLWETAVKMPICEKPFSFCIAVRETAAGFWRVDYCLWVGDILSVAERRDESPNS
jgi:hypothetical protein